MIMPFWLNTRSTGVDVAGTQNTFSSSGCSICTVASAFSCNHVSSLTTGDDACAYASSRYFSAAPLTVTPTEVATAVEVRRRLYEANSDDRCLLGCGAVELSSLLGQLTWGKGQSQGQRSSRSRPRPWFFVLELSSRSRTVLEDPIPV